MRAGTDEITDEGLKTLATFPNIRALDLAHNHRHLGWCAGCLPAYHLETLNLTSTVVDNAGIAGFRRKQTLRSFILFETKCTVFFSVLDGIDEKRP